MRHFILVTGKRACQYTNLLCAVSRWFCITSWRGVAFEARIKIIRWCVIRHSFWTLSYDVWLRREHFAFSFKKFASIYRRTYWYLDARGRRGLTKESNPQRLSSGLKCALWKCKTTHLTFVFSAENSRGNNCSLFTTKGFHINLEFLFVIQLVDNLMTLSNVKNQTNAAQLEHNLQKPASVKHLPQAP